MGAIIVISYLIACLVFGGVMTSFVSMFRSVSGHDNFMSWRWILGFAVVGAVSPYAYMEAVTRHYAGSLDTPVSGLIQAINIKGELAYYRVTNGDESHVRVLAVANENTTIRFVDRVIVEINFLKDKKGKWVVDNYEVLNSFERQKDAVVLPPMF